MESMQGSHERMERIKELECLHRLSALVQKRDLDLSQLLLEIAQFIPSAWQYPESACARIVFDGKAYSSLNFRETIWKQISNIDVTDHMSGTIEVCYLEEKKEEDEGPFLTFERKLIESIARLLGETIERRKAEEKLQRLFHQEEAVSQLGQKALKGIDLPALFKEAVHLIARILDVSFCRIMEHLPEQNALLSRAGFGWSEEEIERTIVKADTRSQAGYTLLNNQSVVVVDLRSETRFHDQSLAQEHGLVSGTSVVIRGTSTPYGVLSVHTSCARVFTQDEVNFLEAIANILASAAERNKADKARRDYQLQLRTLASQLSMVEQQERLRIATELHDGIAQSLAMTKMKLSAIQQQSLPAEIVPEMDELRRVLDGTIRSTRSLSFNLSPPVLQDLGLEPALEWLAERMEQEHTIKFAFEDDCKEKPLDENLRNLLFTMVRELVVNVIKHAKAKDAKISVWREGEQIQIEVQDRGRGFIVSSIEQVPDNNAGGFGLFSIRERLRYFGGRLDIVSVPGSGTSARITAPLKPGNEDNNERNEG
jgi:signal transduction histidine kinase